MPNYFSFIFLSVLSLSFVPDVLQTESHFSRQLLSSNSEQFVSKKKSEKENDKSPHRGTGRRDFYNSQKMSIPTA